MTIARDLSIIAADPETDPAVEQGDLSLALAGAELIDLIDLQAVVLEGDRLVPDMQPWTDDPVLQEAASALIRQAPHETVEDWLWRRGRGLAARYRAALEAEGLVAPARPHRNPFSRSRPAPTDSPDLRRAADRWTAREPVLVDLAAAAGITGRQDAALTGLTDEQGVVLGSVYDAVTQLAAVRQRKAIEEAAFDNIWRGE